MADQRDKGISWTDETWNPIGGCSIVSPACTNCYAMGMAARIERMSGGNTHYAGTTKTVNGKPVWTGKLAMAPDHIVTAPLRWKRPRRVFVNSMSDLFHEDMPEDWIDRVFAVMALAPQHTFQVLTKRPERMRRYIGHGVGPRGLKVDREALRILGRPANGKEGVVTWPLPNVWLGVTAEDQTRANERIPSLLETPAVIRFVSAEPLLGAIDFNRIDIAAWLRHLKGGPSEPTLAPGPSDIGLHPYGPDMRWPLLAPFEHMQSGYTSPGLDWVIVGGESGPGARPTHPDWVRSIRDQCATAGVAFHFKQWGDWAPICNLADGESDTLYRSNRIAAEGESQLAVDEIHGRTCKVPVANLGYGGATGLDAFKMVDGKGGMTFFKLGKARAGRTLDGKIHDAFPEAP